jgi:TetR/AcrR family transcriptional regulator, transcriptional repressor for nem operon
MSRPIGLEPPSAVHLTKQRLLEAGLRLMLERGYHAIGVQEILDETGIPKGSFYHHFESKEEFALDVIDLYQSRVRALLDRELADRSFPPLDRVRNFFAAVGLAYEQEGYLGCLLGGLGQELSGASEMFRRRIEACISAIAARIADCLEEARVRGELPASCDARLLADLIVNAWEGAALRSRLVRGREPLDRVLEFCFAAVRAS